MITVSIETENAAWLNGSSELELEHVLEQVTAYALNTPMGPNGFVKSLLDSNGKATGKLIVTH